MVPHFLLQRIFEVSRSKWWQLIAGPLIGAVVGLFAVRDSRDRQLIIPMVATCSAMGLVAVLILFVRDAWRTMNRSSGIARLTPSPQSPLTHWGDRTNGEIDDAAILNEIVRTVGRPPRAATGIAAQYHTPPRPPWLTRKDLISRIYDQYRDVIERGEVRWAAVIHANNLLFALGDVDCPSQVVYAPDERVPLARLRAWARACYAVKNTKPADPTVRKIADMLTNEFERALDWPLPPSLCQGGKSITTVVMVQRELLPLGIVTCPFLPVFADPQTKLAVLVPSAWWPAPLVDYWVAAGSAERN